MPFGTLTDEERDAALRKAIQVRSERAQLKKELKRGALDLPTVLGRDDNVVGRMKVVTLLESLPGYGKIRARRLMDNLGIAELRRVQGLNERQRTVLLDYFITNN